MLINNLISFIFFFGWVWIMKLFICILYRYLFGGCACARVIDGVRIGVLKLRVRVFLKGKGDYCVFLDFLGNFFF